MYCPVCVSKSKVTDTRLNNDSVVVRKRKCTNAHCESVWTTYEIFPQDFDVLDTLVDASLNVQHFVKQKASADQIIRLIELYEQKLDQYPVRGKGM